jgi:hypothetical protein
MLLTDKIRRGRHVTRLIRALALAGALLALTATVANAAPSPGFQFEQNWTDIQPVVEQQSPGFFAGDMSTSEEWVRNPTSCLWDLDDQTEWDGTGKLTAGASASASICVIDDEYDNFGGDDHMLRVDVDAPSPDLKVTLVNDRGLSVSVPRTSDSSGYHWHLCVRDKTPGPFPEIAESNGGTGLFTNYTMTVTSTGRRDIRSPLAIFQAPLVGAKTWMDEYKAGCR